MSETSCLSKQLQVFPGPAGHKFPLVQLGCFPGESDPDSLTTAVVEAVKAGYRGFDTAQLYGTHKAVGAGLHKCFKVG